MLAGDQRPFNSDHGGLAITNAGKSIAIWSEGFSWIGPGGAWFNIER